MKCFFLIVISKWPILHPCEPLLAVGAVHHHLIELGLRTNTSLIVTTGQAWSTHHFACLIRNGASAIDHTIRSIWCCAELACMVKRDTNCPSWHEEISHLLQQIKPFLTFAKLSTRFVQNVYFTIVMQNSEKCINYNSILIWYVWVQMSKNTMNVIWKHL